MEKAESCPIKRCLQSYCVAVALQRYIAIIVGGKSQSIARSLQKRTVKNGLMRVTLT